jgi:uracil-DNA glycosylase
MARRRTGPHVPKPGEPVSELLPDRPTLPGVRDLASGCKACDLYARGTQTVFGEGPKEALIMLVGEQPGDVEDLAGRPFVGPAGQLLDRALDQAGIDRATVYLTNVVKHAKWEARGKRRIHVRPNAGEIRACRPWLDAEIALVKPRILICLGATAAQALLGRSFRVSSQRGDVVASALAPVVGATIHPSSILRAPDDESRKEEMRRFVNDLKTIVDAKRTWLR